MPYQVSRHLYDFLKDLPPFSFVKEEAALLQVAGRVKVQYYPNGSIIFGPGKETQSLPETRFQLNFLR